MAGIRRNRALAKYNLRTIYVKRFLHLASLRATRCVCIRISPVPCAATCPFSSFIIVDESDPITPGYYLTMVVPGNLLPQTV